MKNILILGGHGFLGKNIAQKLSQENAGNLLIASRRTGVNLFELNSIRACIKSFQPDVIYHCAAHVGALEYFAKFSADILRENLQINLNLYEAVKYECPTCTIINPIANCAYPGNADLQKEANWLNGPVHESVKPFGNARRVVYFLSECYKNQYGIKSKNFLIPNTFGPGDYTDPERSHALNGMIVRMILAKQRGEKTFQIWGSGNPVREWGYVRDIANVLYLSLSLEEDLIKPLNIAQNKGFKIKESAEMIADLLKFKGELKCNIQYKDGAPLKILDDTKFKELFNNYCFTPHKQAISETIKYYNKILTGNGNA